MGIQAISFTAKQRFENHKPILYNNANNDSTTLDVAINRYNETQKLNSMVEQAKKALVVTPSIINDSNYVLLVSNDVVLESQNVQQKAEKIMAEIIDTNAYLKYCADLRAKINDICSYLSQINVEDEIYDIKITSEKIIATQKNGEVYIFSTDDNNLIYCAKGIKKHGLSTMCDREYFFNGASLEKVNLDILRSEFNSIYQCFEFCDDNLVSFCLKTRKANGKTIMQRYFEYESAGVLSRFSTGYSKDESGTVKKEFEYGFEDGKLKTFRKDFVQNATCWCSKLFVQFENENNFYIEENVDSTDFIGYSSICFYQNGKIEGSII